MDHWDTWERGYRYARQDYAVLKGFARHNIQADGNFGQGYRDGVHDIEREKNGQAALFNY